MNNQNEAKDTLKIKNLTPETIKKLQTNERLFGKFLNENLGFVYNVVLNFIGGNKQHPNYEDFFQIGCVGLLEALNKFNTDKITTFSTFAFVVIKNAIRQEIKKLNKQKNIIKNKNGEYVHRELSIEKFLKKNDNTNNTAEYYESSFKKKNETSFDDDICNNIVINEKMQNWSNLEQEIFILKAREKLSLKEISEKLQEKYKEKSLSRSTVSRIYFGEMKSKLKELYNELNGEDN